MNVPSSPHAAATWTPQVRLARQLTRGDNRPIALDWVDRSGRFHGGPSLAYNAQLRQARRLADGDRGP